MADLGMSAAGRVHGFNRCQVMEIGAAAMPAGHMHPANRHDGPRDDTATMCSCVQRSCHATCARQV